MVTTHSMPVLFKTELSEIEHFYLQENCHRSDNRRGGLKHQL